MILVNVLGVPNQFVKPTRTLTRQIQEAVARIMIMEKGNVIVRVTNDTSDIFNISRKTDAEMKERWSTISVPMLFTPETCRRSGASTQTASRVITICKDYIGNNNADHPGTPQFIDSIYDLWRMGRIKFATLRGSGPKTSKAVGKVFAYFDIPW